MLFYIIRKKRISIRIKTKKIKINSQNVLCSRILPPTGAPTPARRYPAQPKIGQVFININAQSKNLGGLTVARCSVNQFIIKYNSNRLDANLQ